MKDAEIIEKLKEVFKEVLEIEDVEDDLQMENTPEWDSLKHLQLLVAIEKAFGLEIDFQESIKMTSMERIKEIVKEVGGL